ncbi:MAG: hypothetical protein EXR07_09005 [Acetobacteraceae bacterium]|nr:hypothetical protein [Acetobacteraceae bacterium]
MSFTGVLRPGHIQIRVTDMDQAVRHCAEVVGFDVVLHGMDGRVYLKARDEFDHHSVILRQTHILDITKKALPGPATSGLTNTVGGTTVRSFPNEPFRSV